MLQALIWDVDGTIAETERDGHRVAFNVVFEAFDLPWRWDIEQYGRLLHITGGRERLLHDFEQRQLAQPQPGAERDLLAWALHQRKNHVYAELVASGAIQARPGVLRLMQQARQAGLRQAIATTTSRSNVEALLGRLLGAQWRELFDAVVCGEDVERKKPDPQAYRLALQQLGVPASAALAIEDAEPGLRAALAADVPVLLTPSVYFPCQVEPRAWLVCQDLDHAPLAGSAGACGPLDPDRLQRLHEGRP
jgi:HAD superfamily hydrolase (TIGR01509 family)